MGETPEKTSGGLEVKLPRAKKYIYKFECGICHEVIKTTNKVEFMKRVREHLMSHGVYATWWQLRLLAIVSKKPENTR